MNIKDDFILSNINDGYLVGGAVRDYLLSENCNFQDRDIAVKGAKAFAKELAEQFEGTLIVLDDENQIYRVVLQDKINYLDISEIVGDSIEEDLQRRDFTINAIAYNLKRGEFVDTTGGMDDLKQGIIRTFKESNFTDDPLRLLRAFRFMAVTGFKPADETKSAITKYKHLLMKPSLERINYEIMKLFGGKYCSQTLKIMDEFGILEKVCPYVKEMKQVPPNAHHHLDLFNHSIETVRNIEELYENADFEIKKHLDRVDFGGFPRINHLKLAGLLHDIGKFSTWTIEEDTHRHRFLKHDDVGSKMCVQYLKNLKFSKKQIEYISFMIKNHMYPSNVISAPDLSEKVMMRYLRKTGNNVIDNIILAKADRLSARGEDITEEMVRANLDGLDKLLNFYLEKRDSMKPLPKLLDGFDVMKILNIKASSKLGKILDALKEEQLNGNINTKEEAEEFIKKYKN